MSRSTTLGAPRCSRAAKASPGTRSAIDRGDLDRARHLLAEMATELAAHWQGEETGLFGVMAGEEMFAEIAPLVRTASPPKLVARSCC